MAIMIAAPILARTLERNGSDLFARCFAWVGYSWMGFILLCFLGAMVLILWDGFAWGVNRVTGFSGWPLCGKRTVLILISVVFGLCLYGVFEARGVKTERLDIVTDKLPARVDGLTIVQISDVHLGLLSRTGRLRSLVDKVAAQQPDILVSTGDLIDGDVDHLPELAVLFDRIQPKFGKYAVTGNHEYYAGLDRALAFHKQSGFSVLRGDAITVDSLINIAGVDYSANPRNDPQKDLLSVSRNGLFTLLLKHAPDAEAGQLGRFDLQLSGHTHGGQIFPFNFITSLRYPFVRGYKELGRGSHLYVSRGSGSWGPQMRILSPPEITVIRLVRGAAAFS